MGFTLNYNTDKLYMYKKEGGHIIHMHFAPVIWVGEDLRVGFTVQRPTNINQWATHFNPGNNQEND